ncbi:MAG: transposase [Candidatus Kapabacteria bacterium]|nr:transposase [Candidatus Kapabacteria bacterium]
MKVYNNQFYHIFNRTNNHEALFRTRDNYIFFLKKFKFYMIDACEVIAYCLMPTHFHFLLYINDELLFPVNFRKFLISYSKAFNKAYDRNGSLFQQNYKSILIEKQEYLINLATYIHQNPVRSKLVDKAYEWEFSSYLDYIDLRKGTLPNKKLILDNISINDLKVITGDIQWLPDIGSLKRRETSNGFQTLDL